MRIVIQRVKRASVSVEEKVVGSIQKGFLVLIGVGQGDDEAREQDELFSLPRDFCDFSFGNIHRQPPGLISRRCIYIVVCTTIMIQNHSLSRAAVDPFAFSPKSATMG